MLHSVINSSAATADNEILYKDSSKVTPRPRKMGASWLLNPEIKEIRSDRRIKGKQHYGRRRTKVLNCLTMTEFAKLERLNSEYRYTTLITKTLTFWYCFSTWFFWIFTILILGGCWEVLKFSESLAMSDQHFGLTRIFFSISWPLGHCSTLKKTELLASWPVSQSPWENGQQQEKSIFAPFEHFSIGHAGVKSIRVLDYTNPWKT
jgi:hypothetical protein